MKAVFEQSRKVADRVVRGGASAYRTFLSHPKGTGSFIDGDSDHAVQYLKQQISSQLPPPATENRHIEGSPIMLSLNECLQI